MKKNYNLFLISRGLSGIHIRKTWSDTTLLLAFFLFYVKMETKQDQTVLYRLQFVKETQTNTV